MQNHTAVKYNEAFFGELRYNRNQVYLTANERSAWDKALT